MSMFCITFLMEVFAHAHSVCLNFDFHELRLVILIESERIDLTNAENVMNPIGNVEFNYLIRNYF